MDSISQLKERLAKPMPGYSAQAIMEPPLRNTFSLDASRAKKAATVLCLYKTDDWHFILIKRSSHPKDKHKGQIGFPGGSLEEGETSMQAAIRELEEELNIKISETDILGKLSDLYIPVSNFLVSPYIAKIDLSQQEIIMQESEVVEVLHIKLEDLLDDQYVKTRNMTMANGFVLPDVPYFDLSDEIIWGATAMMLSECKEVMKGR